MPAPIPDTLQKKVADRLAFYQDLGVSLFYRDRRDESVFQEQPIRSAESAVRSTQIPNEELTLPKPLPKPNLQKPVPAALPKTAPLPLPAAPTPSLFDAANKVADDTLLRIREDLGECTRCKLHKHRHTIVFGDGNPKAELVFVGEGPGADEDAQGLPFVGRAGKLLTQMIEAMGLQRKDVYICNVVKCRPPENRTPEKDECDTCSPFLLRQIEVIQPQMIVALGAVAAKNLLGVNDAMGNLRGRIYDFRGTKLVVTYHPAYLLRDPRQKAEAWKDLQMVMRELGMAVPKKS